MYTGASLSQPKLAIPLCVQEIYALRARCSIPERLAALPAEERSDLIWIIFCSKLLQPTENDLREHFNKWDKDNNNAIDRHELEDALRFAVLFMHLQHTHAHIKTYNNEII